VDVFERLTHDFSLVWLQCLIAATVHLCKERIHNSRSHSHKCFHDGEPAKGHIRFTVSPFLNEDTASLAVRIGQLDDREITSSLGKRLLMILSPFVFLQVTPHAPDPDVSEGTVLHWIPLLSLANDNPVWSYKTVHVASRLAPRNSLILRSLIRALIGNMQFSAIVLNPSQKVSSGILKLWGLTLGMTLDLLAYMRVLPIQNNTDIPQNAAPRMTSVVPRFSYPDVNFWIWVFGKRYREVVRSWESSLITGGSNDRRINWVGTALNSFYAAVRKALVLVLILRGIGILVGLGFAVWWLFLRV